jgi:hypothetical protein
MVDFESTAVSLSPDVAIRITLVRDGTGHVSLYINRVLAPADRLSTQSPPTAPTGTFEFDDTTNVAAVANLGVAFFIDDSTTGQSEAGPGSVRRITIYDVALTAAQVAVLP